MSRNPQQNPPGWIIRFLKWFCPAELYEGIIGDMLEQFEKDVQTKGVPSAKRKIVWNGPTIFSSCNFIKEPYQKVKIYQHGNVSKLFTSGLSKYDEIQILLFH